MGKEGNTQDALKYIKQSLKAWYTDKAYLYKGIALRELGHDKEAEAIFRELLTRVTDPRNIKTIQGFLDKINGQETKHGIKKAMQVC